MPAARRCTGSRTSRERQRQLHEDVHEPERDARSSTTPRSRCSRSPKGDQPLNELLTLARDGSTVGVKGNALFWLAQRAGQKAVGTITAAIENDPDTEVKKKAVFALSQLPKDEGVPLLIQQARTNKNPVVRKQAMFWLGQSKDPRALKFFEEILK